MPKMPLTSAGIILSTLALAGLTAPTTAHAKTVEEVQAMIDQAPDDSIHTTVNENGDSEVENTGNYVNSEEDPLSLSESGHITDDPSIPTEERVVSGEFHNHTNQSNDASEKYITLENVLNAAFREDVDSIPEEGKAVLEAGDAFDYYMTQDHFRKSPRDIDGNEQGYEKPTWKTIQSQIEKFNELKAQGKYEGKIYYPGFEWDMFGLDHVTVAIIEDGTNRVPLDAIRHFEWLYSYDTPTSAFTDNELEVFGPRDNVKADKTNAYDGLRWLQEHYPDSFFLVNHPSRHNGGSGVVAAEDIRKMIELAPDIVAGLEGMPGNQMGGDRGEMSDIYGGADLMVAKLGGIWDSLLGEGHDFFNYANSDFHFKISTNEIYSSGYWPSEYSRNYTKMQGDTFQDVSEALKAGNSWSVYGDLISGLEFFVEAAGQKVEMGQTLEVSKDTLANLTIRFKETETNNYKPLSPDHLSDVTNHPILDHIDLIVGNIFGEVKDKALSENPTTRIQKRFTKENWSTDGDGWHTIKLPFVVDQDMYMRLRGTNHGLNTPDETDVHGNPLQDPVWEKPRPDNEETFDWSNPTEAYKQAMMAHFNRINDRNYSDLWFYSNPIKLMVNDGTYTIPEAFETLVKDIVKDPTSINNPVIETLPPTDEEAPTIDETPETPETPEIPETSQPTDDTEENKHQEDDTVSSESDNHAHDDKKTESQESSTPVSVKAKVAQASVLPATGEHDQQVLLFTGAALSILTGLGLMSRTPREQD